MDRELSRQRKIILEQPLPVVWHICANRWHSAITEYAFSAHASLQSKGIHSHLLLKADSAASNAADQLQLKYLPIAGQNLSIIREYYSRKTVLRPTHVFCYGGSDEFPALFFGRKCRRFRFRGDFPRGLGARPWFRGVFQGLSNIETIYPSDFLRSKIEEPKSVETSKVVYLGRDASRFMPLGSNDRRPEAGARPTILIVGRLDPIKGHREFMTIFSMVLRSLTAKKSAPLPHLRIIGEPKNLSASELRNFAAKLGLIENQDWSFCTDRIREIEFEMKIATIGAIPSLGSELIVRVAEEFILCGTPIFTSGAGSLDEISTPEFGWSYLGCDKEKAALMLELAFNQAIKEDLQTRNRRASLAAQRFSNQSMATALISLIQN